VAYAPDIFASAFSLPLAGRGVMARKGDAPEYVRKMQKELFEVLGEARSRVELRWIEPRAREVAGRYRNGLGDADVRELSIHRRVGRSNYSRSYPVNA